MALGLASLRISSGRARVAATTLLVLASGCSGLVVVTGDEATDSAELTVPGKVRVNGVTVDVEGNYLPRVVQCENPGAPFEAMKAQAVAARTYLAYRAAGRPLPSIVDGESEQVYTCPANLNGRFVSADAARAVKETAGQVVTVNGRLTAGFFVAGATRVDVSCRRLADPTGTEHFVTYNYGKMGSAVSPSSIGARTNLDNHGCLSQNMANCLADSTTQDYKSLLRYFYGSDVQIATVFAATLSAWTVEQQATKDIADAACFSMVFGRPVPLHACVQSGAGGQWYQCGASGDFTLATQTLGGTLGGPDGACREQFPR